MKRGFGSPIYNDTSLRKDQWKLVDQTVLRVARERLMAWQDLTQIGTFSGFDGMAKTILETERVSDSHLAHIDMEGLTEGANDSPRFDLIGLPLPIIHSDFKYSKRKLAASRASGTPLDLTSIEQATRRVVETIEKLTIGTVTGPVVGTAADYADSTAPQVYGYTNFPSRITSTGNTVPTGSNGNDILDDWLAQRKLLHDAKMYGPYNVYVSTGWDEFLDAEFKTNSDKSLRQRLLEIEGVDKIQRLDFLTTDHTVIWVQKNPATARAVVGMNLTTLQWEAKGGMELCFKVMAIMVPQLRADFAGNAGILHATT